MSSTGYSFLLEFFRRMLLKGYSFSSEYLANEKQNTHDHLNVSWSYFVDETKDNPKYGRYTEDDLNSCFVELAKLTKSQAETFAKDIEGGVNSSFLNDDLLKQIKAAAARLLESFNALINAAIEQGYMKPFFEVGLIDDILNSYFELLKKLYRAFSLSPLPFNGKSTKILNSLLRLGIINSNNNYISTPFAPLNLLAQKNVYDIVNWFALEKATFTEGSLAFYVSMALAKIERLYRYNLADSNGHYLSAMVRRDNTRDSKEPNKWFEFSDLDKMEIIEELKPIRFLGKLESEYDSFTLKCGEAPEEFRFALIGSQKVTIEDDKPRIKYVEELYKTFTKYIKKHYGEDNPTKIICSVYSKFEKAGKPENINGIECHEIDDSLFNQKEKLFGVIEGNNVCIFSDAAGLYYNSHSFEDAEVENYINSVSDETFVENYDKLGLAKIAIRGGALSKLYDYFSCYARYGKFGFIRKEINEPIITALDRLVREENEKGGWHSAYFLFSDIYAAENFMYTYDIRSRSEMYSGKKFIILRFGETVDEDLGLADSSEKIIVFPFYQVVKSTALMEGAHIGNILHTKDKSEDPLFAENILIGLDYSNWQKGLRLSYSVLDPSLWEGTENMQHALKIVENVIKSMLSEKRIQIRQCCKNGLFTVLYGRAKSVDDMLLIHLFYDNECFNSESFIGGFEEDKLGILESIYRKNNLRFSDKRHYEVFMRLMDRRRSTFIPVYEALSEAVPKIREQVSMACKANGYTNSNLYMNIREMTY